MRRLHRVAFNEKFVASGTYIQETAKTVEHWSIHELPDGSQFIRVDYDDRAESGRSILAEAWRGGEGGRIERLDLVGYGSKDDAVKEVRTNYIFEDGHVSIGRTVNGEPRQREEHALPDAYAVNWISTLFYGLTVLEAAKSAPQPAAVFHVNTDFQNIEHSFTGEIAQVSVVYTSVDHISFAGGVFAAHRFEQITPTFGKGSPCWLDQFGILLLYQYGDNKVSALTQYSRRPEPK